MLMRLGCHFAVLVLSLAASLLLPLQAQQFGNIVVSVNQSLGPVNRLVFGQNINAGDNAHLWTSDTTDPNLIQRGDGYWDPAKAQPVALVVNESKAVGTSMLRYPGGCMAHNFDWRKTIGPDAKKSGWLFGLDEYMTLCRAIGAIPLITVSDYALPVEQMPENAAALVEYLNSPADAAHPWAKKREELGHPAPYNVTWFELGNESIHGNHRVLPHRQYTPEQYAVYANTAAAAMRKVDPKIKIGIVLVPGPGTDVNSDWNHTVVHLAGESATFVVIHMYAPQQFGPDVPQNERLQSMLVTPQQVEEHLHEYHQMIQQQLGHDLPLAITEFNGAIDQPDKRFSFGNALECADMIRVFLKPESNVVLANYWDFLNGPFGMLHTNESSPDGEPETEMPALLLYKLWAQHFGSRLVKVDVQGPRSEFAGAGSAMAAKGDAPKARTQIQRIDLDQYTAPAETLGPKLPNIQIQRQDSGFSIKLENLNHSIFPVLARMPRPQSEPGTPVEYSVSFDARLTPDSGSDTAPMGIGLMDSRGWNQTHSGIGLDAITTAWKSLNGTYRLSSQTPGVDLTARLMAEGKNVSGTLEIRNLVVADYVSATDAAYPLLTSSASTSSDGQKLYLMVINKSASDPVGAVIHLASFSASRAQYWEVNGPGLESVSGVTETDKGALPLSNASLATHVFPAHSMTAIEFSNPR